MKINNYIKDLLYKHDIVVIPGFGGFDLEYFPSETKNTADGKDILMPPSKQLIFNKSLTVDDGILADYIADLGKITIMEARELISGFVKEAFEKIELGEKIYFDEIGNVFLSESKELVFEQDPNSNFLVEAFALSSVEMETVNEKETPKKPVGIKKGYVILIISVVVLLCLAYPVKIYIIDPMLQKKELARLMEEMNKSNENVSPDDTDNLDLSDNKKENTDVNENKDLTDNTKKDIVKEESKKEETKKEVVKKEVVISNPSGNYFLIAGSFSELNNANKRLSELKNQGFEAYLLEREANLYRIAVGSFDKESAAKTEMNKINSGGKLKTWLYKKK